MLGGQSVLLNVPIATVIMTSVKTERKVRPVRMLPRFAPLKRMAFNASTA